MEETFNTHDLGDLVKIYTKEPFRDAETTGRVDPTIVNVSVKTPSGVVIDYVYGTDPEVIKDDIGEYHMLVDANEAGAWFYRFWSTGEGQAADEHSFYVRAAEAIN